VLYLDKATARPSGWETLHGRRRPHTRKTQDLVKAMHSDAGDDGGGRRNGERRRSTTRAVTDAVGVWRGQLFPAVMGADGERRGHAVPVPRDDAAKSRGHAGPVLWGDAGKRSGHAAPSLGTKRSGCSTRAAADVAVVLFVGAVLVVWAGWC
jgi:hypothetical protein